MISGSIVGLRAVEKEDLKYFQKWRNFPKLKENFREYREINFEMQNKWFEKIILSSSKHVMFSIVDLKSENLIGCCGLCYIDWVNRNAEISIYIGKDNQYIDSFGYAKDATKTMINYGFNELSLVKLWAEVYEYDFKKTSLFESLKMHRDGELRKHKFHDGKWWNSIIFSII